MNYACAVVFNRYATNRYTNASFYPTYAAVNLVYGTVNAALEAEADRRLEAEADWRLHAFPGRRIGSRVVHVLEQCPAESAGCS